MKNFGQNTKTFGQNSIQTVGYIRLTMDKANNNIKNIGQNEHQSGKAENTLRTLEAYHQTMQTKYTLNISHTILYVTKKQVPSPVTKKHQKDSTKRYDLWSFRSVQLFTKHTYVSDIKDIKCTLPY